MILINPGSREGWVLAISPLSSCRNWGKCRVRLEIHCNLAHNAYAHMLILPRVVPSTELDVWFKHGVNISPAISKGHNGLSCLFLSKSGHPPTVAPDLTLIGWGQPAPIYSNCEPVPAHWTGWLRDSQWTRRTFPQVHSCSLMPSYLNLMGIWEETSALDILSLPIVTFLIRTENRKKFMTTGSK